MSIAVGEVDAATGGRVLHWPSAPQPLEALSEAVPARARRVNETIHGASVTFEIDGFIIDDTFVGITRETSASGIDVSHIGAYLIFERDQLRISDIRPGLNLFT